jgi:tight adherence protein C
MNAPYSLPLVLTGLPFATGSTLGLVVWPLLVGLSCHWLLTAPWQPLGRPRPDLRERLRRLNVEEPSPHDYPARGPAALPLLPWPALDALLRPLLEDVSGSVRRVLVRLGLDGGREVAARLRLVHPVVEPEVLLEQFWGRKLLCGLAPLALFLLVKLFGTRPLAGWPLLAWLLMCAGGFLYPNYKLNWLVAERHARIVTELPTVIDLLAIGLAGGQSLEQTLLLLPGESRGLVAREFAAVLREVAASQRTLPHALEELAARNDVPELTGLLTHLRSSIEHGTADLVPVLTAQAATLREQQRLRLLAEARRAQVRMLLPVGVGILPVLIVVLLAPAAMQLLGLGG